MMNRLKQISLLLILGLLVGQIHAQTDSVYKFTLEEAQDFAVKNYYLSKNAQLDIDIAKKKVWETTAIGLPQVSAKLQGGYTPELSASIEQFSSIGMLGGWMYGADQALYNITQDPNFGNIPVPGEPEEVDPNAMKWNLNATVTVSQLIFSGSYIVGLQSAKVYKSISTLSKVKTDQDIKELVSNSYFNVLIASENKKILQSTYASLNKSFVEMQQMSKQGFIEDTDVDQMELTVSNIKSSLDLLTRLEGIALNLLKTQVGININSGIELNDSLSSLIDEMSYENLVTKTFNLNANISYALLENQVKASELLLKLDKAAFLPDLAAFYQYQKEFNDNAFTFTPPHTLGVSLNIPLVSSGQRMAKVSQSKLELIKAQNSFEQIGNSIKVDFQNSKSTLIAASEKFSAEKKNLALSKKIYDKALIRFNNGMISSIDLTQIQNQYFTAQRTYYSSLQELISAKNKLEKLLLEIK